MQIRTRTFVSKETFEQFLNERSVMSSAVYPLQPNATIYFDDPKRKKVIASEQGETRIIYGIDEVSTDE